MTTATQAPSTIAPSDLASRIAAGEPCDLLDVRTPAEYAAAHAAGAKLAPLDSLDCAALAANRDDKPLYILCKSGGRARKARDKFLAANFPHAIVVEGGTDAWIAANLPVVRGASKVISLERQVRIAAGLLVLTGVILALTVHPLLILLSGFIGAGLIFAGITDTCGMGMMLAKMPWNRCANVGACCGK